MLSSRQYCVPPKKNSKGEGDVVVGDGQRREDANDASCEEVTGSPGLSVLKTISAPA